MLTKLTQQRTFAKTSTVKTSPPSRFLANYAKASGGSSLEVSDTVTLSEQAQAKPKSTSSMRKLGNFVALGLSFVGVMAATGCGGGAAVTEVQPEAQAEQVQDTVEQQTQEVDLQKESAEVKSAAETLGQEGRKVGEKAWTELKSEGQRIGETFKGKNAEEIAETIGQEGRKVGEQAWTELKTEGQRIGETFKGKNAEEIAETIGQEGRKVGKQLGEEGKKIGKEAAKVGKEVGKVAKGFWRGITGKNKKKN